MREIKFSAWDNVNKKWLIRGLSITDLNFREYLKKDSSAILKGWVNIVEY